MQHSKYTEFVVVNDEIDDRKWRQLAIDLLNRPFKPPLQPTLADRYKSAPVLLGYGGFGVVFKAKRKSKPFDVALKMFPRSGNPLVTLNELRALRYVHSLGACDEKGRGSVVCYVDHFAIAIGEQLFNEMRSNMPPEAFERNDTTTQIEKPLAFVTPDSQADFIETKFVGGFTLQELMKKGKSGVVSSFEYNLALVVGLLEALGFMHRHGIVHRDVKPGNIKVIGASAEWLEVTLLDLGVACRISGIDRSAMSRVGVCNNFATTLPYAAPNLFLEGEQRRDANGRAIPFDHSAVPFERRASYDVYALGMTLFDWSRGREPTETLSIAAAKNPIRGVGRVPQPPYFSPSGDNDNRVLETLVAAMLELSDERRATVEQLLAVAEPFISSIRKRKADEQLAPGQEEKE